MARTSDSTGSSGSGQPGKRDYRAERRRRDLAAQREGFAQSSERARYRRQIARDETFMDPSSWIQKQRVLKKFGVTETEFIRMRAANLQYVRPKFENWNPKQKGKKKTLGLALRINEYDIEKDLDESNWSEERVGYITSFYRAIVDPRSNYDSLKGRDRSRKMNGKFPTTNRRQWDYLVKYSKIMSVTEFERRYGVQYQV